MSKLPNRTRHVESPAVGRDAASGTRPVQVAHEAPHASNDAPQRRCSDAVASEHTSALQPPLPVACHRPRVVTLSTLDSADDVVEAHEPRAARTYVVGHDHEQSL